MMVMTYISGYEQEVERLKQHGAHPIGPIIQKTSIHVDAVKHVPKECGICAGKMIDTLNHNRINIGDSGGVDALRHGMPP